VLTTSRYWYQYWIRWVHFT